ncbi:MAG: hypothetical protein DDT31_01882 [Syntrophomonadaceae bacterium]|nr:hypothetical protein [Bacillota bacterium]
MFFLPILSENKPAGMLAIMPVNVDTAATMPTTDRSAPKCDAKSGSTGLFDIVELNIAKSPVLHKSMNGLVFIFIPYLMTGMHTVKSFTNAQFGLNKHAFLYPLKIDCLTVYKCLTLVVLVNLFTARIPTMLNSQLHLGAIINT